MVLKVKCPTCGREIEYSEKNPWRPFCSERCKLIDLGAWAEGAYAIKSENIEGDDTVDLPSAELSGLREPSEK